MACFTSVCDSVECAVAILRAFDSHNQENPDRAMHLRIGLSAGEPVAEDKDLFGATVQLAARLCACAQPGQIIIPSDVHDLCLGKKLPFNSQGERERAERLRTAGARLRGGMARENMIPRPAMKSPK